MAESIISAKSYLFANRIIKLEKFLSSKKQERIISKQLFRSGTSIGANVAEAVYAQSQADFINKHQIALKEASESRYWIRLLHDNEFIDENMYAMSFQFINTFETEKSLLKFMKNTLNGLII